MEYKELSSRFKNMILKFSEPDPYRRANKTHISDDPKTWGMCCSKEAAIEYSQQYKRSH